MPVIKDRATTDDESLGNGGAVEEYDDFLIAAELLKDPRLARIYVYVCYFGPTTIDVVIDALELKRATTYEDVEELERLGAIDRDDSTRPHEISAAAFAYVDPDGITITPTVLHAIALREIDDDVAYVYTRYGAGTVAAAVRFVAEHYAGRLTKRMVASELDVKPVEGISLVNALERVVAVGAEHDPYFDLVVGDAAADVETSVDATSLTPRSGSTDGDE
ncbi:hypothetical protein [Halorubrum sp. 48-1-W]|uniref:DUF7437 domain-containing protein n=1 Tax=Halorubrum sp. 48-1-W TaxID=2249761 RepID=UPI0018E4DD8F|nr:hypothetical protein [Halorubrum sp. 48-1-W]